MRKFEELLVKRVEISKIIYERRIEDNKYKPAIHIIYDIYNIENNLLRIVEQMFEYNRLVKYLIEQAKEYSINQTRRKLEEFIREKNIRMATLIDISNSELIPHDAIEYVEFGYIIVNNKLVNCLNDIDRIYREELLKNYNNYLIKVGSRNIKQENDIVSKIKKFIGNKKIKFEMV